MSTIEPTEAPKEPARQSVVTNAVVFGLGLVACLSAVAVALDVSFWWDVQRIVFLGDVPRDVISTVRGRLAIELAELVVVVLTAPLFLIWFYRAYVNLGRLGISGLRWRKGWAVGAWFIPGLNLVRPKALADDLWRGSDPGLPAVSPLPSGPVPRFLSIWWTAVVLGTLVGLGSELFERRVTTLRGLQAAMATLILLDALAVVSSAYAIIIVCSIAARQKTRIAVLTQRLQPAGGLLIRSVQGSPAPQRAPANLEALRTPGGKPCPECSFENHPLAVSCLKCHKRF